MWHMQKTRQQWQTHSYEVTREVDGSKPSKAKERAGDKTITPWTSMQLTPVVAVGEDKINGGSTIEQHSSPMRNERFCSKNDNVSIVTCKDTCPKAAQRKGKYWWYHQLGPQQPKRRQNQHLYTKDLSNQGMREEVKGAPLI
jgi:hypothetical protein